LRDPHPLPAERIAQIPRAGEIVANAAQQHPVSARVCSQPEHYRSRGASPQQTPDGSEYYIIGEMVGDERLELPTSSV
jgi:hypothetical protein